MIGNDIVDLDLAGLERKSENRRLLEKIFSLSEISMIARSGNPEIKLWILWSMKEAAYKAHHRKFGLARRINPKDYVCDYFNNQNSGQVSIENKVYPMNIQVTPKYIHSYTCSVKVANEIVAQPGLSKNQLLAELTQDFLKDHDNFEVSKDLNGVPSINLKNPAKKIPFSFSHHGNFTALCIPLINC